MRPWFVVRGSWFVNGEEPCKRASWGRGPRRWGSAGGVVVVAGLIVVGCGGGKQQQLARPAVPVMVAKVEQKTVAVTFRAIGHVESIESVAVRARVGGELQKVWFAEGQPVGAGETLFTIDPRPFETALAEAEARLARDQALLAKAQADTARYAGLVKQEFVTREQFDQLQANAAALRAGVAADQATVESARLQLDYCTIKAPIAGRTGDLLVTKGNLVKANDDRPLVTLNQTRPIYVVFSVPAQILPTIVGRQREGIKVAASMPGGGQAGAGVLTFIDNAVDPTTSTLLLKATFANQDEKLWPGQFVDVVVTLGEEAGRFVVPTPAVQTSQQGQYVFVVREDGTVEMRTVKVDRSDEREAVIESGLAAGETVVTDGQLRLSPGSRVEIKQGLSQAGE
ncbi:MAG: efflux RND transporter periplasmic adaptor subunit [Acidobacteriota bacterium]